MIMGSIISRAKRLRITRVSIQITALVLFNLQFLNRWLASPSPLHVLRGACVPGLHCHACPFSIFACPLGVFVNSTRTLIVPYIALGIVGLVATLGGRLVCGWICPFGFLQDLLYKLRTPKLQIPVKLSYTKYVVLVVFILAVPYLWPHDGGLLYRFTFCDGCPAGTLEGMLPLAIGAHFGADWGVFGGFTARFFARVSILLAILVFVTLVSRGFCRMLCPLGAIFGLFNRFSLFRFNLARKNCNGCSACAKVCPVHIDPVSEMNTTECIRCYECTSAKHIGMGVK